jgi:hypothetical protein
MMMTKLSLRTQLATLQTTSPQESGKIFVTVDVRHPKTIPSSVVIGNLMHGLRFNTCLLFSCG